MGRSVGFDLLLPTQQPNPWWYGTVALYLDAPSVGLYNRWIGLQDLTGLALDTFHRVELQLPEDVMTALQGPYSDLRIKVVLNVPSGTGTYLIDRLTFELEDAPPPPPEDLTLSVRVPAGLGEGYAAVGASGTLRLADRVEVTEPDGAPAAITNTGAAVTELGAYAWVGDVTSRGSVLMRSHSTVNGDVRTSGTLETQDGWTITGEAIQDATLSDDRVNTWTIRVDGPSQGDRHIEVGQTEALAPGRYGMLTVKPGAHALLRSGTYLFDSIDVQASGTLDVDDAEGPIQVLVRNSCVYRGSIASASGEHPALILGILGTEPVVIEKSFSGTIVAPAARLLLGGSSPTSQVGSFFAENVEVYPDAIIEHRAYLGFAVQQGWTLQSGPYGYGAMVLNSGGRVLAETGSNVVSISSAGVATELLPEPTAGPVLMADDGASFTTREAGQYRHYDANGGLISEGSCSEHGWARPVPGTDKVFAPVVEGGLDRARTTHARFVSPGGAEQIFGVVDMRVSRVTDTHVIYATRSDLVRATHDGTETWRLPLAMGTFKVSRDESRLIGLLAPPGSNIIHVDLSSAAVTGPVALSSAFWNMAIAPGGRYSAATTKNAVYVFDNGELRQRRDLELAYANSMDVSDDGTVVIGGQLEDHRSIVMVLPLSGPDAWWQTGETERDATRPYVRFFPDGSGFTVNEKLGLTAFALTRSH